MHTDACHEEKTKGTNRILKN